MESSPGQYGWRTLVLDDAGNFVSDDQTAKGGEADTTPAIEMNGITSLPADTVVWLIPKASPDGTQVYTFLAPTRDEKRLPPIFFAKITAENNGSYGYIQQEYDNDGFLDMAGGLQAGPDELSAAIEANGATGIAVGTIILLYRGPETLATDDGEFYQKLVFSFSGSVSGGFWGRLTAHDGQPYTNGTGGYSWVSVAFGDDGTPTDSTAGAGAGVASSNYPLGLVYDANGETRIPEGTILWLRSGPLAIVPDSAHPGATTTDQQFVCNFFGPIGFWAKLTGPSTGGGTYPFRQVFLHGGKWQDRLRDSQPVLGTALEVNGRNDQNAGAVVKIWVTNRSGTPGWRFAGVPTCFWATITGNSGNGSYGWVESYPPLDLATGNPATPRTGQATETNGCTTVPTGASVWLDVLPDPAGNEFRFRYSARPRVARRIQYNGGGQGELLDAPGGTVPISVAGGSEINLAVGGGYVGFDQGNGTYTIPFALPVACITQSGIVSLEDQAFGGGKTFHRRLLIEGSGTGEPSNARPWNTMLHLDALHLDPSPGLLRRSRQGVCRWPAGARAEQRRHRGRQDRGAVGPGRSGLRGGPGVI